MFSKTLLVVAFAITSFVNAGCSAPAKQEPSLKEALGSLENEALIASGCTYMSIQKALFGLPQSASDDELKAMWGKRTIDDLKILHGLHASATTTELYRKVIVKLTKDGCRFRSSTDT